MPDGRQFNCLGLVQTWSWFSQQFFGGVVAAVGKLQPLDYFSNTSADRPAEVHPLAVLLDLQCSLQFPPSFSSLAAFPQL